MVFSFSEKVREKDYMRTFPEHLQATDTSESIETLRPQEEVPAGKGKGRRCTL